MKDLKRLVRTAQGIEAADLVLKNAEACVMFAAVIKMSKIAIAKKN